MDQDIDNFLGKNDQIISALADGFRTHEARPSVEKIEKATLAEIAHRLGREALENVAATANPTRHDLFIFQRHHGIDLQFCGSQHFFLCNMRRSNLEGHI
jgi:hypothetical protein